jgi:hypothetical protein
MEALDAALSLDDVLIRMRVSQWPSRFCHQNWLEQLISPSEIDILEFAARDRIRISSLEDKINDQYSCIVSFRELSGPFGFLVDLDSKQFSVLMSHLALYIYHNGPQDNQALKLREDAVHVYQSTQEGFSREGAVYRNAIASYTKPLHKMLAVSFGSSAERIDIGTLSKMGFFCLRALLCSQLSNGFMNILMLRLHPDYVKYNPFQYANDIACRNTKLSFLVKYLLKQTRAAGAI